MKNIFNIVIVLFLLCSTSLFAQQITIPFQCGFEDPQENANWVVNSGPNAKKCLDQWYVGNLEFNEGHNGLYISADTNQNVKYGNKPNVVVTYRTIDFPAGSYDVSFDYKVFGNEKTSSVLYVCVLAASQGTPLSVNSGTLPSWVNATARVFNGQKKLHGSTLWQANSFQLNVGNGRSVKLAFVWQNNNIEKDIVNPFSACIDNIQITSTNCAKPSNLTVLTTCDTMRVSWDGVAQLYELQYRQSGSRYWRTMNNLTKKNALITGLDEGGYDVRVRGVCGTDTSAYISKNSLLLFCPENHCINYVDLENANTLCEIGEAGKPQSFTPALVDNGPNEVSSRHTVNWTQDQYDPRTENKLRTIPQGEFASVRLGNWNVGGQAERVSFSYTVDSATASILLLKYAVVFEDPGHDKTSQPQFLLEILDASGTLIDPDCGEANFYADKTEKGWNVVGSGGNVVVWKDWTTIGLNLGKYDQQTLTIRLTTNDCTWQGHYGYAYFTLGCSAGQITGASCGDVAEIKLAAPFGFNYNWYNPSKPEFSSDKMVIEVPSNDISTYYCDVSQIGKKGCFFTLSTKVFPRFPRADFAWDIESKECRNFIKFKNKSAVWTKVDGKYTPLNEDCQTFYWDINKADLKTSQEEPIYAVEKDVDSVYVSLVAGIAEDACQEDTAFWVKMPKIGENLDTINEQYCFGGSKVFGGEFLMKSGQYVDIQKNRFGCDSTTVLNLTIWPQVKDSIIVDTICFGETRTFNGKTYSKTEDIEWFGTNDRGCDSVAILKLFVRDEIKFKLSKVDIVNSVDEGEIIIEDAPENSTYSINGEKGGSLKKLQPGKYTIIVYNEFGCASAPQEATIQADCLELKVTPPNSICQDETKIEIPIEIGLGIPTTYSITFDQLALDAGFVNVVDKDLVAPSIIFDVPEKCKPNYYSATLDVKDVACKDLQFVIKFDVLYSSSIIQQKWNDALALLNDKFNGGYKFLSYQWYKNGVAMPGEIGSYYYLKDGQELVEGDMYSVMLTRVDDGVIIPSCEMTPVLKPSFDDFISISSIANVRQSVNVKLATEFTSLSVYSSVGQLIYSMNVESNDFNIIMPDNAGLYFVYFYGNDTKVVKKILVTN